MPEEREETVEERKARWRSVSVVQGGVPRDTKTKEVVKDDGTRVKVTKDTATKAGNLTIEHSKGDRQDVRIRPDFYRQSDSK